ncbi:MAG TPA: hypothetical protein VFQ53_22310 [Kofleriaceae bacterium]|nr:hypothetical protein [Kofleriaceae bacterium]
MKTAGLLLVVLAVGLAAAPAHAGGFADALKRHSEQDVSALRDRKDDVAARCTLGAVYARRSDLSRAALYLAGCDDAELPDDIGKDIRQIYRDVRKQLEDYAVIEVDSKHPGFVGEIDALPGERFAIPTTLYLKPGHYTLRATANGTTVATPVNAVKRSRGIAMIEADPNKAPPPPRTRNADFTDDPSVAAPQSGSPAAVKHKNMMRDKYLKGMQASGEQTAAPNPDAIEDPMAVRSSAPYRTRDLWLGLRLGGGMFDDGATAARAGVSIAAAARYTFVDSPLFGAARLDYSRRGGDALAIDAIGASAGVGYSVTSAIAVIGQLRGELRLASSRMELPVSRAGLAAAIGAELALPSTPFTAGLRFEQGLTTVVPDTRDRAVLLEVGVDWR